jgi:acyl-CoA dehydrogenase
MIDKYGTKSAKKEIAMIKIVAPSMAAKIVDLAIQIHGGAGVSDDTPLAYLYANSRTLRLADGPDEVHLESLYKLEITQ